jgi:hypothetical protein
MILSNIGENLALLNNRGNDDSVSATVPAPEPHASLRSLIQAQVIGGFKEGAIKPRPRSLKQPSHDPHSARTADGGEETC